MMRESTWRVTRVGLWFGGLMGAVLIVAGVANGSIPIVAMGLALIGFMNALRWAWNRVPTATDDEIDGMSRY